MNVDIQAAFDAGVTAGIFEQTCYIFLLCEISDKKAIHTFLNDVKRNSSHFESLLPNNHLQWVNTLNVEPPVAALEEHGIEQCTQKHYRETITHAHSLLQF